MRIGALGDIHGAFDAVQTIMRRHPDVPLWLSTGDVASDNGDYFVPVAPFYRIKGNNEDFDVIEAAGRGEGQPATFHYLPNGGPYVVGPWRVATLGGTFAPTWYTTPAAELPRTTGRSRSPARKLGRSRDDKRRHFVREEVLRCEGLDQIDVFLTHEAPRPFYPAGRKIDAGKTAINVALAGMRPHLHLFGHHHEFSDSMRQGVRSIGLDLVTRSYVLIEADSFDVERLDT